MKRLATSLSLATLLLSVATASAQTTFRLGLRAGTNRALTTLDEASATYVQPFSETSVFRQSFTKSAIYAWQIGPVVEMRFGKVALQSGLLFSQKGERVLARTETGDIFNGTQVTELASTNRYNWLEASANAVYTLHGDHGLQLFAGPYLAVAVGGHHSGGALPSYPPATAADQSIAYGADTANKRFDVGLNAGFGYRQGPVQVQLGYGTVFSNLRQSTTATNSYVGGLFDASPAHNRVLQLTGTYFFAL